MNKKQYLKILILFIVLISQLRFAHSEQISQNKKEIFEDMSFLLENVLLSESASNEAALFEKLDTVFLSLGKEQFFQYTYQIFEEVGVKNRSSDIFLEFQMFSAYFVNRYASSVEEAKQRFDDFSKVFSRIQFRIAENRVLEEISLHSQGGFAEYVIKAIQNKSMEMMVEAYHPYCIKKANEYHNDFYVPHFNNYFSEYQDAMAIDIKWEKYGENQHSDKSYFPVQPTDLLCINYVVPYKDWSGGDSFCSPAVYENDRWYLVMLVSYEY
ncbi:MAG: hypothetical protein K8S27_05430 [Candidatus Omnitrophica bacterium]|nr:hypothetical protein [Candidatus Omnitrophota bacterium]